MTTTKMFREAAESGQAVERQIERSRHSLAQFARSVANDPPTMFVTCARGSSDHAAMFLRYLLETRLNIITSSLPPSVVSVYGAAPNIGNGICVVVSQSGRSPDLLAVAERYRAMGNRVLALVNDETSPLAGLADFVIPLSAGAETSVAATKSFIATLFAILQVAACYPAAGISADDLCALPALLHQAWDQDWSDLVAGLADVDRLYTIGRGPGLAIASEAALKFKETCNVQAEAFSAAEVRHGPMALLSDGIPLLVFRQDDPAASSSDAFSQLALAQGSRVFIAGGTAGMGTALPCPDAPAVFTPLLQIQSFYRAANAISLARGLDPDSPPMLRKVTETM